jgi:hypothetical protein
MVQFGPKGPKTVKSEKREMKYVIPFLDIATSRVGTARCRKSLFLSSQNWQRPKAERPEDYRTITVRKVPELPGMDGMSTCASAHADSASTMYQLMYKCCTSCTDMYTHVRTD